MIIYLRDRSPAVVAAWRVAFVGIPVRISQGDIFDALPVDGIVSPANSHGWMDGGIDLAYKRRWPDIEQRVQATIAGRPDGLPVGTCQSVPIGSSECPWMLVAPTMPVPMPVPDTANAYLAFLAALRVAEDMGLGSIVCPGLCTWAGQMHPGASAWQMRAAWRERSIV